MTVLKFSLTAEATARIYEILICLAKFGEVVSLEARAEKLTITALNLARTAYASFKLDAHTFFIDYEFQPIRTAKAGDRFTCQFYNKALQSVFKGRAGDRGREPIERCDVSVQDQADKTACWLLVKLLCRHGTTKTYRLAYEEVEVMHALFDKTVAKQGWRLSARILREYIEYFGSKTEQLDLLAQEGKIVFTSFTEKIQNGKEVLKQPLETAIQINTDDFEEFHMQEDMHIVISVKDFKAIVTHAETLRGSISANFSYPTRPLQFSYQNAGIHCEFTLMTTGDFRGASSASNPRYISNRSCSRQPSATPSVAPATGLGRSASEMPPPPRPVAKPLSSQSQRPPLHQQVRQQPNPASESDADDSLFVPIDEDDRTWDPPNYAQEEQEEEMLGWDAGNQLHNTTPHPTFRDSGTSSSRRREEAVPLPSQESQGLPPTQRLSQLHGMFD